MCTAYEVLYCLVACQCTESGLESVKLSAQSMTVQLSVEQKVKVFHSVFDDVKESNAELAAALEAAFMRIAVTEIRAAALLIQNEATLIRMYPDTDLLKAFIERGIQSNPEISQLWYENQPLIVKSFVK